MRIFKQSLLVLAAALFAAVGIPASASAINPIVIPKIPDLVETNPNVYFEDPGLAAKFEELLAKQPGDKIKKTDAAQYCASIKYINPNSLLNLSRGTGAPIIKSLVGIEAFATCNYSYVYLENHQISDLTPLSSMTSIVDLSLKNNNITDISPIAGLTKLTKLDVSDNHISNLSALGGMTQLISLGASNNNIKDLTTLSPVVSLQYLNISGNQIADLSPLQHMPALGVLQASENQIADLGPIGGMTSLRVLELEQNQIDDVAPLAKLLNMTTLHLSNNRISKITTLSGLTFLQELALNNNRIADISPLRSLNAMKVLYLSGNLLTDITPLGGLINIITLEISDNKVRSIAPIRQLTNLNRFSAANNQLTDLTPLMKMKSLNYLDAGKNRIVSIEPLGDLPLLNIDLRENAIDLNVPENRAVFQKWIEDKRAVAIDNQRLESANPAAEGGGGDGTDPADPAVPNPDGSGNNPNPPKQPVKIPFVDIDDHWAKKDIEWAYEINMVAGVSPGIFSPDTKTTESQFLKMLLLAMNGVAENPPSDPWSLKYYDFAAANRYPMDDKKRDEPITRLKVAELIAATQGVKAIGNEAIQYLLDHKLTNGKTAPTIEGYKGSDNLTRAEAVRFIRNVLSRAEYITPQPLPEE